MNSGVPIDLTMNMPYERFQHLKNKIRNKHYPTFATLTLEDDQKIEQKARDQLIETLKKELLDLKAKLKKESRALIQEDE